MFEVITVAIAVWLLGAVMAFYAIKRRPDYNQVRVKFYVGFSLMWPLFIVVPLVGLVYHALIYGVFIPTANIVWNYVMQPIITAPVHIYRMLSSRRKNATK